MPRSFIGTLHFMACALTASSLCTPLDANAQTTDRYHLVDRPTLESLVNSSSIDYPIPFIIVAADGGMAVQSKFNSTSTSMLPKAVTLQDKYAETEADDKTLQFLFEYQGKSSSDNGLEFKVVSYNPYNYLGTSADKFVLDGKNAKTKFTFIYDEADDEKFQIQSEYYKNGEYQSINYLGTNDYEGFRLTADDTKGLSLYRMDYFSTTLSKTPIDENTGDIKITLNPHKDIKGTVSYIKYILNGGKKVTIDEILASEHYVEISWKGYTSGQLDISLPNYDTDATTLWTLPVIPDSDKKPAIPYGPVYQGTYSDISTGIASPEIATDDVNPFYYTLQGIQVARLDTPGIYICRHGDEVRKVIIR